MIGGSCSSCNRMPCYWCAKYPKDIKSLAELPPGFTFPAFARKVEVVAFFSKTFPHTDTSPRHVDFSRSITDQPVPGTPDHRWISVIESDFMMTATLFPDDDWCTKFLLRVQGEDSVIEALRLILRHFDLRAYDQEYDEFFDLLADSASRLREEKAARLQYMTELYRDA